MASQPLWQPSPSRRERSRLARFLAGAGFGSPDPNGPDPYDEAWAWSVGAATAGAFWERVADEFALPWHDRAAAPIVEDPASVTGVRWFPGATLNYAEMALDFPPERADQPAVLARSQTRPDRDLTWADLRDLVGRVRAGLVRAGVGRGDRVAGYLPNIPETLAVMLAAASLGAVWTCCAPEMGVSGSLDRLAQAEPKVLVAVDGYRYGSRSVSRLEEAGAIRDGLPTLERAVWLPYLDPSAGAPDGWEPWSSFAAPTGTPDGLVFEPVPFDHPLYILFSSGTTGKPKAIVHGHGGMTLEHTKALALHFDLGPGSTFFWYTTTGWMMWNFCVSGLLVGSAVVLYDGDPAGRLWELMASTGTTCGGVGAGFLVAGLKAGDRPGAEHDLSRLEVLGSTGSPLPGAAAEWVYSSVAPGVLLASFSGGTDVCTGFVGASPLHPVWAGEISCRCLGAAVEVFDDDGRPVVGREGELVLTRPLPSMPVGILGDSSGERYRATYFERFPGVWAHGDRATLTERGTVVITGRSDGTLNRGGVRMGTAEFYSVVEGLDEVADSLAVHLEDPEGGPGRLLLFVVAAGEPSEAPALVELLRATLRRELSPRHVPDEIHVVASIPRTLSGKKLEVPVKRILAGVPLDQAVAVASVADPSSLDPFVALARPAP